MAEFGFIKSMYGNDTYYPDSALKRYSRCHNSGSTWIFNNFGSGYSDIYGSCGCGTGYSAGCCGGGWGRGLWGGLLGAAAGALVAGGLYSVGRWIFNGGLKGLFKREEKPEVKPEVKTEVKPEVKTEVKPVIGLQDTKDLDEANLATFANRVEQLLASGKNINDTDKEAVDAYNKKIDDLIGELNNYNHLDAIKKDENNATIKNLIAKLTGGKLTAKQPVAGEDEILIDGKPVKIDEITLDDLTDVIAEELNDKTKINRILTKLGYIDENGIGKMSGEYKVLLLLQKSGINVKCATNPNSSDVFVQGKIENVQQDADGKVSYTIDNSTAPGDFSYKYSFKETDTNEQGQKVFNLTKIDKNGSTTTGYVENNWKTKNYVLTNEGAPLITTGNPLISHNLSNDRTQLEDILE